MNEVYAAIIDHIKRLDIRPFVCADNAYHLPHKAKYYLDAAGFKTLAVIFNESEATICEIYYVTDDGQIFQVEGRHRHFDLNDPTSLDKLEDFLTHYYQ